MPSHAVRSQPSPSTVAPPTWPGATAAPGRLLTAGGTGLGLALSRKLASMMGAM